ncbi:methyltransferase domain-containing protein [uncultured Paraglaciecola sp.]|uniref:methyltransferase domain-containing protein n=1 Tax=uncultured Paraglaciecola sp. TaxID=1765024 RepID=UPI0025E6F5BC|nr:methyltransferase domain-containing protein [uncultured Paraglaciecola sp.]
MEPLICLKDFPVFIGCTSQSPEQDCFADMNWHICPESGCIQLLKLLPPEVIYGEYHSEAVGGVWSDHHDEFVLFCKKFKLTNVLEIGGSNGEIAKRYIEQSGPVGWTIVEPTPNFLGNDEISVIKGFFDPAIFTQNYKHIVHSHVLEHTLDPLEFLHEIYQFMQADSMQVFSVPNLYTYLESKFSNTINFEHTFLLTEYLVDFMLEKQGFEIVEKRYFQQHSIFYAVRKAIDKTTPTLVNHRAHYESLFLELINYYKDEVNRLNSLLVSFDGDVYLFGAHIFSQFLTYFGLDETRVVGILDNSKEKNGKRLYGTSSWVSAVHNIADKHPVAVIVKAGQYQQEVIKQLRSINPDVVIWE